MPQPVPVPDRPGDLPASKALRDAGSEEPRTDGTSSRDRLPALVFVLLASLYAITASGWIESSDGQLMYRVARSIVEEGSVAVPEGYLSLPGRDGRRYAPTGIGISLLMAPLYAVGRALEGVLPEPLASGRFATDSYPAELCVQLVGVASQAAIAALLCHLGARIGFPRRVRVAVALGYGLGTIAWPDAKHVFAHPPATALLLAAACAARAFRDEDRHRDAVVAGALCGAAMLVYVNAGLAVVPLALYLAGAEDPRRLASGGGARALRPFVAFVGGLAPGLLGILAYNAWRFGTPFETGYGASGRDVELATPLLYGLYGLLLSTGKSLFLYSPPLVLSLAAYRRFRQDHLPEAVLVAMLATTYLLVVARLNVWHGDWAWGPRYLSPIVPFAMLPVGSYLAAGGRRRWAVAAAFGTAGAAVQLLGVLVAYETHLSGVPNALVRELHELYSEAHFVPQKSPLVGHARLAARALRDLRRRGSGKDGGILYGRGWIEPELDGAVLVRRSAPLARLLVPVGSSPRKLAMVLDDNGRPDWPPADVRFRIDGVEVAEVWLPLRHRSFPAAPLTLPRRASVKVELPLPAGAAPRRALVEIVATPWRDPRRTGGRELGIALRAIALDGIAATVDGDISWSDTGFLEKNTLVHRSLDLWWIRCYYTDLPRSLLAIPAALSLLALAAAGALVHRL